MDEKIYNKQQKHEKDTDYNEPSLLDFRQIINMDNIMKMMEKKIMDQNVQIGYSVSSEDNDMNKKAIEELSANILVSSSITQLSIIDMDLCLNLYISNYKVKISTKFFSEILFKNPFDVTVMYNSVKILEVDDDIRAALIKNYWMPTLKQHYEWIKLFGICPFYFEPIIVKQKKRVTVHYIPKIPHLSSGVIYTYMDIRGKQAYFWKWVSIISNNITQTFNLDKNIVTKKGSLITKNSKYIFFNVQNAPTISGKLTSDIMLIIPEYLMLRKMIDQSMKAGDKIIEPPCFIEFSADFKDISNTKATPGANIDLMRLKVDLLKNKLKTPLQGMDDFSGILGEEIDSETKKMFRELDVMIDNTNKSANDLNSPVAKLIQDKNQLLNRDFSLSNVDLGLNTYGSFFNSQNDDEKTLESYRLYAFNHPQSEIASIIRKIDAEKMAQKRQYKNTIQLNPFYKVANHSPRISMPGYDLGYFLNRMESLIGTVCEMPVEVNFATSSVLKATIFKEKTEQFKQIISQKSLLYQEFVKQLWIMAYTPFVKNTKQSIKAKKIDIFDYDLLNSFDKIMVTFPKYPQFLDRDHFVDFYKMGLITTEQFYDYMCQMYDLEKQPLTKKRLQRIEDLMINPELSKLEMMNNKSNEDKKDAVNHDGGNNNIKSNKADDDDEKNKKQEDNKNDNKKRKLDNEYDENKKNDENEPKKKKSKKES
jgi:hypothetical protein